MESPFERLSLMIAPAVVEKEVEVSAKDFVFRYTYTLDPHDQDEPIKKFPYKKYCEGLIDIWLRESLILIVKSRQMMVSWLFVSLCLWLARFHKGQYIFFVSKKEDDAGFSTPLSLLSRAFFIYTHLPTEFRTAYKKSGTPSMLNFIDENSIIHGVSQDSDALRQYTASCILSDEMAFQERSEQVFAAAKPTIDGGGKFTGISTPNGKRNLFYNLVHDIRE